MSYENTLIDQSSQLAFSVANRGKEVRGVSLPLIDELIKEISRNEAGNRSLCTNLSDAAIAQLRGVLQEVSNRTFNEAVPMIKNVLEQLNKVINPDIPVAYSQFDCRPVIFSNLWDSPLVAEMVERGRNLTPDAVSYVGMINSADDEEYADLVALASTGLGSFDDELAACLGQYSEEALRSLFVDTFVYGNLPATDPRTLMTDVADGMIGFNAWLVIALWARKLYDIAPKASSVSLGRYRELCVALERHAHWVMAGIFVQRRAYAEAGRLVIQAKPKCVYVLNDLYIKYLSPEEGGTIEAIMGVIVSRDVSGQAISLIDDLKANKAQLETAWNRHVQASQMTHTQSANAQARRQLMLILDETAKWHFGDDTGNIAPEVQGAYRGALDRIASGIQSLPVDFVREAHRHVFELVGNVFYPNSDVGRLLQCLREIGDQKDSGLSAEEIRVIATINYVGDWLSEIVHMGDHGQRDVDFNTIRPMALEAIDAKTALAVVGGVAIAAIVGYGVYKLVTKGKSAGNKVVTAAQKVEDEAKKLEEVEVPGRTIPAKKLIENEAVKNVMLHLSIPMLETIAKNGSLHEHLRGVKVVNNTFDMFLGGVDMMKSIVKTIEAGGDINSVGEKVIKGKQAGSSEGLRKTENIYHDITGKRLPNAGSFEEAQELGQQLLSKRREEIEKIKATEADIERIFGNDKEIDIDKLISFSKEVRKQLREVTSTGKTRMASVEKLGPELESKISAFEKKLKEEAPDLHKRLKEADEANDDPKVGFMDAIFTLVAAETMNDLGTCRGAMRIAIHALKASKTQE